jgi:hypothetical protein
MTKKAPTLDPQFDRSREEPLLFFGLSSLYSIRPAYSPQQARLSVSIVQCLLLSRPPRNRDLSPSTLCNVVENCSCCWCRIVVPAQMSLQCRLSPKASQSRATTTETRKSSFILHTSRMSNQYSSGGRVSTIKRPRHRLFFRNH